MWKPSLPSNWQWKKRVSDGMGLRIALEKSTGYETPMKLVVNSFSLRRISPWPPVMSISSTMNYSSDVGCTAMDHFGHCKRSSCKELCCEDVGSFCGSSPRKPPGQPARFPDEMSDFKVAGFLRSCYLCRKNLDGKDIYMYRGEKAFCSTECRYQQMIGDEHQETYCASEVCRPSDVPSSVNTSDRLFYHEVFVA